VHIVWCCSVVARLGKWSLLRKSKCSMISSIFTTCSDNCKIITHYLIWYSSKQDTNLVENWEKRWSHDTLDDCCGKCKFPIKLPHIKWFIYANYTPFMSSDFGSSSSCNRRDLMALKYYANSDFCSTKAMSKFRALEVRFDSLDDCCHTKFPQYVSDCCESSDGSCSLSGNLRFIPVSIIIMK
jgi:hypothetical protein